MKKIPVAAVLALLFVALPLHAQEDSTPTVPAAPGTGANYEMRPPSRIRCARSRASSKQMEYAVRRIDLALQRLQSDAEQRLTRLESIPVPTPAPAASAPAASQSGYGEEQESDSAEAEAVTGTLGDLKVRGEKVTGAVKNPKTPPLPDTPPDYGLTAQEQYDRAFGLLRQADYEGAEKAFKSFIDKNPKDKLVDNAKYWYAETFYVRAKFNDAAVAFADAYQQNPKGTKAPDSLLKMAMSLGSLEKTQDACTTLNELKKNYPNAPQTIRSRADQERTRLKCGSVSKKQ